jgi:AraC-like DNA-binding protein
VVYAARGVLAVEAASTRWVVPPLRCLWVPAGVAHRVETIGEVLLRTVYIRSDRSRTVAASLRVLDVSPLMRELLLEVVRVGILDDERAEHRALALLMLAEIGNAPQLGVALTLPVDPRARAVAERVCRGLRAASEDIATLAELTRGVGISPRTTERLFVKETGMSFGRWRQQARLQFAVRRLGDGVPVTTVAFECGYDSVSAFITMFKRAFGTTPGQYCSTLS